MVIPGLLLCAIWLYLLTLRGGFWRAKIDGVPAPPSTWPAVTAIVPARNEAPVIAYAIQSILQQDYPGKLNVILVDDHSSDATRTEAWQAAQAIRQSDRLTIMSAPPLPSDWSGKVWAMQQGFLAAQREPHDTPLLWFTDADIDHDKYALSTLVCHAEAKQLTMASCMVKLQNNTTPEKLMIPAFIYFFQILYPFAWINRPKHPQAGAAGGAMLVRRAALESLGGLTCIQHALIDDCALGKALKQKGPIWLGLTQDSTSIRGYAKLNEIWMMIARTAYTQLHYSPAWLIVCVSGMAITFGLPIGLTLCGPFPATFIAGMAWAMMTLSYLPILRLYQQNYLWAILLPITTILYLGATLDSARRYYAGSGGQWKGRAAANVER